MRRSGVLIVLPVLLLAFSGCAGSAGDAAGPTDTSPGVHSSAPAATATSGPTASPAQTTTPVDASSDPEAVAQAQAWLDSANLPSGAVSAVSDVADFDSSTRWPCGPVAELEGFWFIPGWTVTETANWLRENPTASLITTAPFEFPDDPTIQSATVGYIPNEGAQEGIVYTVTQTREGVAVRGEVAAQTATASCPPLDEGEQYGAPGQG